MKKFIHKHYLSPMLFVSNGQKFLCPSWQPVPMETTLNDIEWINPYTTPITKVKAPVGKEWTFPSSSQKGVSHTVRIVNGQVTCSCPGAWRSKTKECKHMVSVKIEIAKKNKS